MVGAEMNEENLDCSYRASGFPENRYEALEESRRLLGLTESDFRSLLRILCRTEYSNLDFSLGRVTISLSTYGDDEVCLNIGLGHGIREESIEYKFRSGELGCAKKQRRLHDFGEE
jgi:hypothetical protein